MVCIAYGAVSRVTYIRGPVGTCASALALDPSLHWAWYGLACGVRYTVLCYGGLVVCESGGGHARVGDGEGELRRGKDGSRGGWGGVCVPSLTVGRRE